jgi:hypothetical protein
MRPAAPMCPLHPDEPLLDPADERVVFELMAIDDRARSRSHARWAGLLGGIGLAGAAGVLVLLDAIGAPAMEFFWEAVIGLTLGGAILGGVISIRRFRPRFAQWTKDPGAEPGGY